MKRFVASLLFIGIIAQPYAATALTLMQGEITPDMLGSSVREVNTASKEIQVSTLIQGVLVEIGNTTNRYTTIVVRVNTSSTETSDETIEITPKTILKTSSGKRSSLDDWIAGDFLSLRIIRGQQSGYSVATSIINKSIATNHQTINGWIEALDSVTNKISVRTEKKLVALDINEARLVVGNQNPALLYDFRIGDRVRARIVPTNRPESAQAHIVVALRRGTTLFMRTTRWIIPATITEVPSDLTLPFKIEIRALPSRFYQEGDINNIFGSSRSFVSVRIDQDTDIRRAYKGNAAITELVEGDEVIIVGRWDEYNQLFTATSIRNLSLQKLGSTYLYAQITAVDLTNRSIEGLLWRTPYQTESWNFTFDEASIFYRERNPFFVKNLHPGAIVRLRANIIDETQRRAYIKKMSVMSAHGSPITTLPPFPLVP